MTHDEFEHWAAYYFGAFPDAYRWLKSLPEEGKYTLEAWFKTMAACDYTDVATVTDRVLAGELEPPGVIANGNFKTIVREQTALHMKNYCERIADDRRRRMRTENRSREL